MASDPASNDRATRLFAVVQQHLNESARRLPFEICQIVEEYSDADEIKAIFRLLATPRDTMAVIGFESYTQMHEMLPLRVSKLNHLNFLTRRNFPMHPLPNGKTFIFDTTETFVNEIMWDRYWNGTDVEPEKDPHFINWKAFRGFSHLHSVSLNGLNLQISMDDLAKLPSSIRVLDIGGNIWAEPSGHLDLNRMPKGLETFEAAGCQGINGSLKLMAPRCYLRTVVLTNNDLRGVEIGEWLIPPRLKRLYLELNPRCKIDLAQRVVLQHCYGMIIFI